MYVSAAALSTARAPGSSSAASSPWPSSEASARLDASNSTGRVTSWNSTTAGNRTISGSPRLGGKGAPLLEKRRADGGDKDDGDRAERHGRRDLLAGRLAVGELCGDADQQDAERELQVREAGDGAGDEEEQRPQSEQRERVGGEDDERVGGDREDRGHAVDGEDHV